MTQTLHKPELDELDTYQGKWVNLWNTPDGVKRGAATYEDERTARLEAQDAMLWASDTKAGIRKMAVLSNNYKSLACCVTYLFPIPVGGE